MQLDNEEIDLLFLCINSRIETIKLNMTTLKKIKDEAMAIDYDMLVAVSNLLDCYQEHYSALILLRKKIRNEFLIDDNKNVN